MIVLILILRALDIFRVNIITRAYCFGRIVDVVQVGKHPKVLLSVKKAALHLREEGMMLIQVSFVFMTVF